jgi:hypothetical protein
MKIPREFWLGLPLLATLIVTLEIYDMRAPTVMLAIEGRSVLVHVHQFGQAIPSVSRLLLTDESSHTVVLDLQRNVGTPRLYFFFFREGPNSVSDINGDADGALYRMVGPTTQGQFEVKRGTTYLLSVWGKVPWGHHADVVFRLQ